VCHEVPQAAAWGAVEHTHIVDDGGGANSASSVCKKPPWYHSHANHHLGLTRGTLGAHSPHMYRELVPPIVCMYVCKDSAAPAHARTRAHSLHTYIHIVTAEGGATSASPMYKKPHW